MLAFTGGMINAAQTTMFALAAHVYPTAMRATGVGTAVSIGRAGAILSGYAGPWALELPRQHVVLRPDGRRALRDVRRAGARAAACGTGEAHSFQVQLSGALSPQRQPSALSRIARSAR